MRKIWKIIRRGMIFVMCFMCVFLQTAECVDAAGNDVVLYRLTKREDNTAAIYEYLPANRKNAVASLSIPATASGIPIMQINDAVFAYTGQGGTEKKADYAFSGFQIDASDGLRIGDRAFLNLYVHGSIAQIKGKIGYIGECAFRYSK